MSLPEHMYRRRVCLLWRDLLDENYEILMKLSETWLETVRERLNPAMQAYVARMWDDAVYPGDQWFQQAAQLGQIETLRWFAGWAQSPELVRSVVRMAPVAAVPDTVDAMRDFLTGGEDASTRLLTKIDRLGSNCVTMSNLRNPYSLGNVVKTTDSYPIRDTFSAIEVSAGPPVFPSPPVTTTTPQHGSPATSMCGPNQIAQVCDSLACGNLTCANIDTSNYALSSTPPEVMPMESDERDSYWHATTCGHVDPYLDLVANARAGWSTGSSRPTLSCRQCLIADFRSRGVTPPAEAAAAAATMKLTSPIEVTADRLAWTPPALNWMPFPEAGISRTPARATFAQSNARRSSAWLPIGPNSRGSTPSGW
jgi:hypothetical protein